MGPTSKHVSGEQTATDIPYHFLSSEDTLEEYSQQRAMYFKNQGKRTHRLVGFCLLLKREVLETIGGFDPRFGTGNCEDDDLCYRALIAGFKLWWAKDVFIHHFGQISFKALKDNYRSEDYDQGLKKNWKIFCDKWNIPDETIPTIDKPIESVIQTPWSQKLFVPYQ